MRLRKSVVKHRLVSRAGAVGVALALAIPAIPADAQPPHATITSAGPLTHIYIGDTLSCQVRHQADDDLSFYPPDETPGDCGTFLAVGDTLFAPNFDQHDNTATGGLGDYTPFTPVSQTPVTGQGTATNPYRVTTTVDVPNMGLRLVQTDTYVQGQEQYRTDVRIENQTATPREVTLYRAGDCYLQGLEEGFGAVHAQSGAVACSVNPNNNPPDRIEQWYPLTAGSRYFQARFDEVWEHIATRQPFPNTCRCEEELDNGAGISWTVSVPSTDSVTLAQLTRSSPEGDVTPDQADLRTTKTAQPNPVAPGGNITYTITVDNLGPSVAENIEVSDAVPANTTFESASASQAGSCTTPQAGETGTVTCTFAGGTDPNTSRTVTLVVRVNDNTAPGTQITNTSTASSATQDPDQTNNSDTATVNVTQDGEPTPTPTPAPATPTPTPAPATPTPTPVPATPTPTPTPAVTPTPTPTPTATPTPTPATRATPDPRATAAGQRALPRNGAGIAVMVLAGFTLVEAGFGVRLLASRRRRSP